jgi:hypothetical protein
VKKYIAFLVAVFVYLFGGIHLTAAETAVAENEKVIVMEPVSVVFRRITLHFRTHREGDTLYFRIWDVRPDSPFAEAGLKTGKLIWSINGVKIESIRYNPNPNILIENLISALEASKEWNRSTDLILEVDKWDEKKKLDHREFIKIPWAKLIAYHPAPPEGSSTLVIPSNILPNGFR